MTPMSFTQTGVGRSSILAVDSWLNPFYVGIAVTVTGTVTFNIEFTMDEPADTPVNWHVDPAFSAATASGVARLDIPCRAYSINVTAGTGTVSAQIIQSGTR